MNLKGQVNIRAGWGGQAFTLIEMMVVVAIIAILATITIKVVPTVSQARAKAQITGQLTKLTTAIDAYHTDYNSYPLDNPTNALINPLFYELSGSTYYDSPARYALVGEYVSVADLQTYTGRDGLRNVTQDPNDPQAPKSKSYISDFKSSEYKEYALGSGIELLRVPVSDSSSSTNMLAAKDGSTFNAWHYQSTSPVYNGGKYDLWADIEVGGERIRISNWDKPQKIQRLDR